MFHAVIARIAATPTAAYTWAARETRRAFDREHRPRRATSSRRPNQTRAEREGERGPVPTVHRQDQADRAERQDARRRRERERIATSPAEPISDAIDPCDRLGAGRALGRPPESSAEPVPRSSATRPPAKRVT